MRKILAGTLLLVIGMGFGRFAFTGLYPQMVSERIFDLQAGAWVASANYAGYLAGAMLLTWRHTWRAESLCRTGLLGSLACLLAMALVQEVSSALLLRFFAGVASAFSMVGASLWLLRSQYPAQARHGCTRAWAWALCCQRSYWSQASPLGSTAAACGCCSA